jgi:hypothetical protein
MKKKLTLWRWWAKSLGEKASKCDKESDKVAIVRSIIFATYLITNCFIVAGVIRHWERKTINLEVLIYENPNYSEKLYAERRHYLGMDRDARIEGVYRSGTVKNKVGEFE